MSTGFADTAGSDALGADADPAAATLEDHPHPLEVWAELAAGDARGLETDPPGPLREASAGDLVSERDGLSAHLAGLGHGRNYIPNPRNGKGFWAF